MSEENVRAQGQDLCPPPLADALLLVLFSELSSSLRVQADVAQEVLPSSADGLAALLTERPCTLVPLFPSEVQFPQDHFDEHPVLVIGPGRILVI